MTASLTDAAGVRRADESKALEGKDSLFRSCRCRPAFRSARSPSASPARSMPRCSPPRCWRSPTRALAKRLAAWRKAQTDVGRRSARDGMTRRDHALAARRDHRHSRRRPARPHAGAGGRAARLQVPRLCARARIRRAFDVVRTRHAAPTMPISDALDRFADDCRRHHLRIRERAGADRDLPGRAQAGAARPARCWRSRRTG